jgi:hypothetical protein
MGNWKAVKLNINKPDETVTELYDLSKDLSETNNVADDNPEMVKKLEELMKQAHKPSEVFPFIYERTFK